MTNKDGEVSCNGTSHDTDAMTACTNGPKDDGAKEASGEPDINKQETTLDENTLAVESTRNNTASTTPNTPDKNHHASPQRQSPRPDDVKEQPNNRIQDNAIATTKEEEEEASWTNNNATQDNAEEPKEEPALRSPFSSSDEASPAPSKDEDDEVTTERQQLPRKNRLPPSHSKREESSTMDEEEGAFRDEDYIEENADIPPPRRKRRPRKKKPIGPPIEEASPETLRKRNALAKIASKAKQWAVDKTAAVKQLRADQREYDTGVVSMTNRGENGITTRRSRSNSAGTLTAQEIEICELLDEEYERALEEREVGYSARYSSVRQSACFSVSFMLIYLTVGTTFYLRQIEDDMELHEALLFLIYTITTVGYGTIPLPETVGFQLFTIVYIFVGIATLTIMVAQCYQWIALEATRAQHARDKADLAQRGKETMATNSSHSTSIRQDDNNNAASLAGGGVMAFYATNLETTTACSDRLVDFSFGCFAACRTFFRESEIGRGISVLFPFAGLIGLGAMVVGPIEGWTFVESLYFSVVSLTTVGFGDFVPTRPASIWFCICWLPFSIGFMSLFLSNVANFYIRLSDKNIQRLEGHLRRKLHREKQALERERAEARKRALRGQQQATEIDSGSAEDDNNKETIVIGTPNKRPSRKKQKGFATLPTGDDDSLDDDSVAGGGGPALFGSPESSQESVGQIRRETVMSKSRYRHVGNDTEGQQQSMSTMKDVIQTVRENVESDADSQFLVGGPDSRFMSMRSARLNSVGVGTTSQQALFHKKPSFALRVLVQERFAEIIATDVAGFQSNVEIKDVTLSVTIDSLQNTADKWLVPRRARKAFRAVAFEALYFVGEHGLITRGADALLDLTPFEFHGIFSPLVAAMGDADTMNGWLASTDVLAEVDLKRETSGRQDLPSASLGLAPQSYAQRMRASRGQTEKPMTPRKPTAQSVSSEKEIPRLD